MARRTPLTCIVLIATALAAAASAQRSGSVKGNPTPGTPQPDPPNLSDRITVVGCLRAAAQDGKGSVPPADLNTASDSTFVVAAAKRETRVPPGTGTSEVARNASSSTYRLAAVNSALMPFVGSTVEVSGEVDASSPPILRVGFIQRVAKTCR